MLKRAFLVVAGLASGLESYATSSVVAKGVVGGLTAALQLTSPSGRAAAPRRRELASISQATLVERLRSDVYEKQYLWTGQIDPEVYAEDCTFRDPTLEFTGLSQFERNVRLLEPYLGLIRSKRVALRDLRVINADTVEARWRMEGTLGVPWRPRLRLDGRTTFTSGEDGRVTLYDEFWENLSATEALLALVRPERDPAPVRLDGRTVVVFPGFGNDEVDYVSPLGQSETVGLKACLERRGARVEVLPVRRTDWLRVFSRGVGDPKVWRGDADWTTPAYAWYLDVAEDAITSNENALVVAHSAGGWLLRALLRRAPHLKISAAATLGTPHRPPVGAACATRGVLEALRAADATPPDVPIVTVAGDAVDAVDPATLDSYTRVRGPDAAYFCGDGVVPEASAHLPYARRQITLPGVLHSINLPGTTTPTDRWYGAEPQIDKWLPALLLEAQA
ncbi:hypothetical protein CTAYLR_004484 [Chrysophaeum taylorii]|uniref:Uncharacterized protein n=1 Tax=Chrysophaeum taylorii TaxID=2483200 RepID=A0AAD7UA20_9STRA|nr:hypothetical protein CTAYLR_004484 [Chrysophaeum taylorii]